MTEEKKKEKQKQYPLNMVAEPDRSMDREGDEAIGGSQEKWKTPPEESRKSRAAGGEAVNRREELKTNPTAGLGYVSVRPGRRSVDPVVSAPSEAGKRKHGDWTCPRCKNAVPSHRWQCRCVQRRGCENEGIEEGREDEEAEKLNTWQQVRLELNEVSTRIALEHGMRLTQAQLIIKRLDAIESRLGIPDYG